MTRSVRFRVTALATVALLVVLSVTALLLVRSQRRQLIDSLEETIAAGAGSLVAAIDAGETPGVLGPIADDDGVAQIVRDGSVVASSANLDGVAPIASAPDDASTWRTVDDVFADDAAYRVLSLRLGDGTVVHAGAPTDDVDESVAALAGSLAVAVPLAALVLAAVVWWLVGRTLRPVEGIRVEVEAIGAGRLDRRVPEPASGDEIDRLARTMNGMLERVELAVEREQQFVADAAHELRTPLARMRTELEVDRAHPASADVAATQRSVLDETVELQALVDDLLHLARSDAGVVPAGDALVDLDAIVSSEAARLRAEAGTTVDGSAIEAVQVHGDAAQLRRAVANLVDNAARHARSTVRLSVREQDGLAIVDVSDDGPGVAAEDRERIFERFTRLDEARTRAGGGSGLGLAIVRDIVARHGGEVSVEPGDEPGSSGARFRMRLPSAGSLSAS